ncbi:MAG: hypothetical protein AAF307_02385 [Pseudomonadota bacterium]
MRYLFSSLGVLTALIATIASGQDVSLPSHSLSVSPPSNSCVLELTPSETQGESPPTLFVRTLGKARPDVLELKVEIARSHTNAELVFLNQRAEIESTKSLPIQQILKSRLWKVLEEAHRKKTPFFLTSNDGAGGYYSSRFEGIEPKGIIAILERQCGFASTKITAKTPKQRAADERALGLSSAQIKHIRWVLSAKYKAGNAPPAARSSFSATERGYIAKYSRSAGLGESAFLTDRVANRLLRETFEAKEATYSGSSRLRIFKDWSSYYRGKRCHISTNALSWTGMDFYVKPQMLFSAEDGTRGNALVFNIVTPNPFLATANVRAVVDGKRFVLQVSGDRILPRREGSGVSDDIMKAIQKGDFVTIRGISKKTKELATITFSAAGFTAAFGKMMDMCNRPALRDWFR